MHKIGDTLANLTLRLLFKDLALHQRRDRVLRRRLRLLGLLAGIFVGGILYTRLGMKRSVLLSLVLMAVSNLSFARSPLRATPTSAWRRRSASRTSRAASAA